MTIRRRAAILAACCGLLSWSAASAETLKIGVVAPLTGGGAAWGLAVNQAAKIAASDVNAAGYEVGGKTYQVEIVAYDDQFKTDAAVAAYNRLTQEDVRFILLQTSNGTMANKPSIESDDVVVLSGGYGSKVVEASNKHLFRWYVAPRDYMPTMFRWMKDNLKGRTVAQINPNIEGGYEQAELGNKLYKELGFEVLSSDMHELTMKDFTPLLTKIVARKPDIIDLGGSPPATTGLVVRQARELGFQGQFVKTGGPGAAEIVAAAGKEAAEGLICLLYADPANAGYRRLVAEYRKVYGQDPNEMILPAYDGTRLMLRAIQIAGTVKDAGKVAASFAKAVPFKSAQGEDLMLGGKETYGSDQEIATVNLVGRIENGEPVIVGKLR